MNNVKLGDLLSKINDYEWSDALYMKKGIDWDKDTECIIWDPDDVEDEEDDAPKIVQRYNMSYILEIATIQDIIENAHQQKNNCTCSDLLSAFLYYYNHDAYIEFNT